jgi:hypothetical protein
VSNGGGFGVAAGAVGMMAQAPAPRSHDDGNRRFARLHQVPIGPCAIPISGGAGVLQLNDLLSVRAGFMWSIRRATTSGYTAGTVALYKGGFVTGTGANAVYSGGGEPILPFAAAGVYTVGRGEGLLDQGDALIAVATGITLSAGYTWVQLNGAADCFEREFLPQYLGLTRD